MSSTEPGPDVGSQSEPAATPEGAKGKQVQAGQPLDDATAAAAAAVAGPSSPLPPTVTTAAPPVEADPVMTDTAIEPAGDESADSDEFEPSEWGEDGASAASTSINSSIYAHTYENGRRYHSYKNGRYPIPNDDQEQNREDMKHVMMLEMTDGKLYYAPIGEHPQKVLDVGTGTGQWAIEVGDKHPSASVLGIDLSPIQPAWVPPNVKFVIDDLEDEWLNGDNYDLVHLRFMSPVIKNVPKFIKQAYDNIKPGGWIEFQELHAWFHCDDGTMQPDDRAYGMYKLISDAFKKMGYDVHYPTKLADPLKDSGFVNVQCVVRKIPVGTWARDRRLRLVGHYLKLVIQDFLPALAGKPLLALGLNQVERELWRSAAHQALEDMSVHRYWNFYFWYGQKPE